jgi:hypothetical protein
MKPIIRTHTYYMTFKEYKKKFLKEEQSKIDLNTNKNVFTRIHIIFE